MNELPARGTSAEAVYLLGTTGEMTEFPMMENVMQREGKAWKDTPAIAIMTEPPGGKRRANTSDTVGAWCDYLIENNQSPGQVLVVSSQPHVAYQQAIVEQVLQSRFPADRWLVESCGPGVVYDASRVAESLDAIARYIYAFFP